MFTRTPEMKPRDWAKKRFCTQKCSAKVPWRRVDLPPKVCEECGREYEAVDRHHYKVQRFCSRQCSSSAYSREKRAAREQRPCAICGEVFGVRPGTNPGTCGKAKCKATYQRTVVASKLSERVRADYASGRRKPARGYSLREESLWTLLPEEWVWRAKWKTKLGWFELDFADLDRKLDVELDGPEHGFPARRERDEARDGELLRRGWQVLRVLNAEVDESPEGCVARILAWSDSRLV